MHPQELTDGIQHVMMESQRKLPVCPFKKDSCGHVDSSDAKQQPTEELQRTKEYTKANYSLRAKSQTSSLLSMYQSTFEGTRQITMAHRTM